MKCGVWDSSVAANSTFSRSLFKGIVVISDSSMSEPEILDNPSVMKVE